MNPPQSIDWIGRARSTDPNYVYLLYQAATVHTLANRPEDALKDLREAFQKGYSTGEARTDPEFESLRHRPEFANLLAEFVPQRNKGLTSVFYVRRCQPLRLLTPPCGLWWVGVVTKAFAQACAICSPWAKVNSPAIRTFAITPLLAACDGR